MPLHAGFSEVDITPPLGTAKIGWLRHMAVDEIVEPLVAACAAFVSEGERVGFIALDTLSIRWSTAQTIRQRITAEVGFPGDRVMVAASHNHCGPAVAKVGEVQRDEAYISTLVDRCVAGFGEAVRGIQPAHLAIASAHATGVSFNRRVVQRNGLTRTHGMYRDPDALFTEGPTDPEVAVLAARSASSAEPLGCLVNFTVHTTYRGGEPIAHRDWPGGVSRALAERGWPIAVTLNGAAADIAPTDPMRDNAQVTPDDIGQAIGGAVDRALAEATWRDHVRLNAGHVTVDLPYREPTDDQVNATVPGAQRFIDSKLYDRDMPKLIERIRTRGTQPAEVQAIALDEHAYVSIPAEYFCALGLRIKERTHPRRTKIVGFANGMVGYVPTKRAFDRGGYETTFAMSSRMAPEAGDLLADAAIDLVNRTATSPET